MRSALKPTFWAVLTALLNFVPYVGTFLSLLFPALMAIVQFNDPMLIVLFIGVLLITYIPALTLTVPRWLGLMQ